MKKDFLSIRSISSVEIRELIAQAFAIKATPSKYAETLKGKALAMIFEKPSLRTRVTFDYPGQQLPLVVTGTTDTGAVLDLSHSSRTGYHSVNPAVATITGGRLLTAVGPGSTTVTVAYQGRTVVIPVTVPKTIPGDFNGDGVVDQDDVNWLAAVAAAHLPPAGTFDARDLNRDGVIDRRDVRRLLSLCAGNCVMPRVTTGR